MVERRLEHEEEQRETSMEEAQRWARPMSRFQEALVELAFSALTGLLSTCSSCILKPC